MTTKRLIRITQNKIFLTPNHCFSLSETNLASGQLRFKNYQQEIYFQVEILEFVQQEKKLKMKVTDYQPKDVSSYSRQSVKSDIQHLAFQELDWSSLEPHLIKYVKSGIEEALVKETGSQSLLTRQKKEPLPASTAPFSAEAKLPVHQSSPVNTPKATKKVESFEISFKKASFDRGGVSFSKTFDWYGQPFVFRIENQHILPEFERIKHYFSKTLGKKKFTVLATVLLTDQDTFELQASSPEIESIDASLIEQVHRKRINKLIASTTQKEDQEPIFTADQLFANLNQAEGNLFHASENDLLEQILAIRKIRNQTQLQYLSGYKHSARQKMRFTLKPLFGFIFFIEGATQQHYCWELLDSHATYVWSIPTSNFANANQYRRVEKTINLIREVGRAKYKEGYKSGLYDPDLSFHCLEHTNLESAAGIGFMEWKQRLNELLL